MNLQKLQSLILASRYQGQIPLLAAKISAVAEYPAPTTKRQLRRFLGLVGYYRPFCHNFATIVSPLTDLVSPAREFRGTPDVTRPFNGCVTSCFIWHFLLTSLDCGLIVDSGLSLDRPLCSAVALHLAAPLWYLIFCFSVICSLF